MLRRRPGHFTDLLTRAREDCWILQDILETLSCPGWLLNLQQAQGLPPLIDAAISELRPVLEAGGVQVKKSDTDGIAAGLSDLKKIGAVVNSGKGLVHLATTGDPASQEALVNSLLPYLQGRPEEVGRQWDKQ